MDLKNLCNQFDKYIRENHRIVLLSHRNPDADTVGAALALGIWLKKIGKEVINVCVDDLGDELKFLPYTDNFVKEFNLKNYDLMIFVDVGAKFMTGYYPQIDNLFNIMPSVNIDHHTSNEYFGELNIVDTSAASATMILHQMFVTMGIEVDEEMATCLLAGLYSDTGSFKHSNTTKEVFVIAADLMNRGGKIAEIIKHLFNVKPVEKLRMWGKVLENAYITERKVIMSVIQKKDYSKLGVHTENISGAIEYLNMVPDTKFAVLINENEKGQVKGSFRTRRDDVNLSDIASNYGGGGHPKASGFSVQGTIENKDGYRIVSEDMSKKSLEF